MATTPMQSANPADERRTALRRAVAASTLIPLLAIALFWVGDEAPEPVAPPMVAPVVEPAAPALPAPVPVTEAAAKPEVAASAAPDSGLPAASPASEQPPTLVAAPPIEAAEASAPILVPAQAAAACPPPELPPAPVCPPAPQVAYRFPPAPGAGFLVQLGVFADTENAEKLRQKLAAEGYPATLQSRVVLGPFPDKAAAQRALEKIRRERRLDGMIMPPRKR